MPHAVTLTSRVFLHNLKSKLFIDYVLDVIIFFMDNSTIPTVESGVSSNSASNDWSNALQEPEMATYKKKHKNNTTPRKRQYSQMEKEREGDAVVNWGARILVQMSMPKNDKEVSFVVAGIDVGTTHLGVAKIRVPSRHGNDLPMDILEWQVLDMGKNLNTQTSILSTCIRTCQHNLQYLHGDKTDLIAIETQAVQFCDGQQGNRYMWYAADALFSTLSVLSKAHVFFQDGGAKETAIPPQLIRKGLFQSTTVKERCVLKCAKLKGTEAYKRRKANKLYAKELVNAIVKLYPTTVQQWWINLPSDCKADAADALLHAYAAAIRIQTGEIAPILEIQKCRVQSLNKIENE